MGENLARQNRLQELEALAREYEKLKRLVDAAANDTPLDEYAGTAILYVDSLTRSVIDVSGFVVEIFGYSRDQMLTLTIDDLEVTHPTACHTYIETSRDEYEYNSSYRHQDGSHVAVKVRQRSIEKAGQKLLYYALEEDSLSHRLWHELSRRDDNGYQFQRKLKTLNEISFQLNHIEALDDLCWQGVHLAVEQLGFDRLSLWFLDEKRQVMRGTYGIDENGQIRSEHEQSWSFDDTHVIDFLHGKTDPIITYDAPLYNEKSQVIGSGWHIAVPMLNGDQFMGFIGADNYRHRLPMKSYEPELLRLYGITIGHLASLLQNRHQSLELRVEQERIHMLKTFITDMGHDFRTPLTIINTNTYLLQRVKDEDRKAQLLEVIQEQALYISTMVSDMLDVVRLEHEIQLTPQPIDLQALILMSIRPYETRAAAKRLCWQFDLDNTITIQADVHYLQQALGRLIKNAVQFTPEDGQITLRLSHDDRAVKISVEDSGIGIEEEHLAHIFNPLYRVNQARTDRGSGLGLSIAKIIVEAHHGSIGVKSVFGKGTTFDVVLPLSGDPLR